jgi:superfamily II RNA helicase
LSRIRASTDQNQPTTKQNCASSNNKRRQETTNKENRLIISTTKRSKRKAQTPRQPYCKTMPKIHKGNKRRKDGPYNSNNKGRGDEDGGVESGEERSGGRGGGDRRRHADRETGGVGDALHKAGRGYNNNNNQKTSGNNKNNHRGGNKEARQDDTTPCATFDEMNLKPDLLKGIYAYGFEKPSAIQQRAIRPIVRGRDVIAQSQSGTGKTAVFSIAALQLIQESSRDTQVLVLSPTRELAEQTQRVMQSLGDFMNVSSVLLV